MLWSLRSRERQWFSYRSCLYFFVDFIWRKLKYTRIRNMPRTRRNHSRSRSRSRSDSRDVKRRRVDYDSPYHRGSFSSERAQRSRQHERGTSAERRYKRSHRRSPTSSNHRRQHRHRHHGGHGSGHTHRGHRDLAEHSRRSYSSSQVSLEKVSEAARTILPRGFLQQHKLRTSATTTANILCPLH